MKNKKKLPLVIGSVETKYDDGKAPLLITNEKVSKTNNWFKEIFNSAGRILMRTNEKDEWHACEYDALGRPTRQYNYKGETTTNKYDEHGNEIWEIVTDVKDV